MTKKVDLGAPRLFDTVKLVVSFPSLGLRKGMVGAVVAVPKLGGTFQVEFSDGKGHPRCETSLEPGQFVVVRRYRP